MNVPKTIIKENNDAELLIVATLATNFALLANVPYDSWHHEGSPAEMAVLVVEDFKKQGRLSFLEKIVLGNYRKYAHQY